MYDTSFKQACLLLCCIKIEPSRPEGMERPKENWRRMTEMEMAEVGKMWN